MEIINTLNDWLWTYLMVALLLGAALFFTLATRGIQFTMIPQMIKLLFESSKKHENPKDHIEKKRTVSSFQAFAVSLASRVGTGNIAGVAIAISMGGPGAIFWMWVVALIGSANAFIESTLAQLFKIQGKKSFQGGPAYYIMKGLHQRWWAITFSILITVTFGLAFNTVQANTIVTSFKNTFGFSEVWVGLITSLLALTVICGGIHRISKVSEIVVPIMACCYIFLAVVIIFMNIKELPFIFSLIIQNAFGLEQAVGGGMGMALILGVKRGLFSNEAGEGSTPNAAATADVSHPVKQGLIQTLGVFTDTLLVCTSTAFIILCSGMYNNGLTGIELTEFALRSETGNFASWFLACAIYLFAFTSIIANYYYGETNLNFIYKNRFIIYIFRIIVGLILMLGALSTLEFVWAISDITMGLMTLCNIIAILFLGKYALICLKDYKKQLGQGKDPQFTYKAIPELEKEIRDCWPD